MLVVHAVTKTFPARPEPVRALDGVDLNVPEGQLTAILGASGCGKTTLLRIIAGFDRPDTGEVRLGGRILVGPGAAVPARRRGIGVVPQEGALFPHLDVAHNIGFGLRGHGSTARRDRADRVATMLDLVGLPGYERRRPDELSGGEQQRVALARALAPGPAAVLLDEPFSALDAGLRTELREEVRDLLRRLGTTGVLVTHDQEEALSLADRVAVMRDGRVVRSDPPRDVYLSPGDAWTAGFVGDAVLLPGTVRADDTCDSPLGPVTVRGHGLSADQTCVVMLRPEQLELVENGTPARVVGASYFGHDGLVRLRLGPDGTGAPVAVRTRGEALPQVGATVGVRVADRSGVPAFLAN